MIISDQLKNQKSYCGLINLSATLCMLTTKKGDSMKKVLSSILILVFSVNASAYIKYEMGSSCTLYCRNDEKTLCTFKITDWNVCKGADKKQEDLCKTKCNGSEWHPQLVFSPEYNHISDILSGNESEYLIDDVRVSQDPEFSEDDIKDYEQATGDNEGVLNVEEPNQDSYHEAVND